MTNSKSTEPVDHEGPFVLAFCDNVLDVIFDGYFAIAYDVSLCNCYVFTEDFFNTIMGKKLKDISGKIFQKDSYVNLLKHNMPL